MSTKTLSGFGLIAMLLVVAGVAHAQLSRNTEIFGDSEYRLGPEDVVQVFVWKEVEPSVTVVIRPDGKLSMPLIGEIVANRKTAHELEEEIRTKLLKYYTSPVVNVIVKEINSPKVSVFGEVKRPDIYKIKQKTTVLDGIALAGGFTEFAKRRKVVVRREGPRGSQRFELDLESMLDDGREPMFYLQPGDTIYVQ